MRALTAASCLAILLAATGAFAASKPTLFYYKTGSTNLLTAVAGDPSEPLSLIFSDDEAFSEDLARRLGTALFPTEPEGRSDSVKEFQTALRDQFDINVRPLGYFALDTVRHIGAAADRLQSLNQIGPVRLIYLNLALQDRQATPLLREFLRLTAVRRAGTTLTDEQIDQCRLALADALEKFVAASTPIALKGILEGAFAETNCAPQAAEKNTPAGDTAVPPARDGIAAPPAVPNPPAERPVRHAGGDEGGSSTAAVVLVIVAALAAAAGGLVLYIRRSERGRQEQIARTRLVGIGRTPPPPEEPAVPETPPPAALELWPDEVPSPAAAAAPPVARLAVPPSPAGASPNDAAWKKLGDDVEELKGQVGQLAEMDRAALKKFNELQLLFTRAIGDLTQVLEAQDRRLAKLEKGSPRS